MAGPHRQDLVGFGYLLKALKFIPEPSNSLVYSGFWAINPGVKTSFPHHSSTLDIQTHTEIGALPVGTNRCGVRLNGFHLFVGTVVIVLKCFLTQTIGTAESTLQHRFVIPHRMVIDNIKLTR